MVSTPGLTRSNGSVSQAGNDVDLVVAEEGAQVVGEALGVGGRRHRDDDRPAPAQSVGQAGEDERPRRIRHGQHRADRPSTWARAGSVRRREGRSIRAMRPSEAIGG